MLFDDAITQGGSIHELRNFDENAGGKVVAVSALERKFGREETEKLLRNS